MRKKDARCALLAGAAFLGGCRSHFVQATVVNGGDKPVRVVELDYPGASFGVSTLAPGATYNYRFKAIGSGATALSYTDASGKPHSASGPVIEDGQAGTLQVEIPDAGKVRWTFSGR